MLKCNLRTVNIKGEAKKMKLNSFAVFSLAASYWPGNYFNCIDSVSICIIALALIIISATVLILKRSNLNDLKNRVR